MDPLDKDLTASVVRENDLEEDMRLFRSSNEEAWYIDRHVLDVPGSYPSQEIHRAACFAAVELAKKWSEARERLKAEDIIISQPIAIIDDDWIRGDPEAAPPHVKVSMARNSNVLGDHVGSAVRMAASGQPIVDSLLTDGLRLWRVESNDPELSGSWLLEPCAAPQGPSGAGGPPPSSQRR